MTGRAVDQPASTTPDGLLIVDKPPGMSSHDVVARCRRLASTRRVGHAGTLDPMATGVLVVGIGRATRLLGYLALETKAYDATIRLGQVTGTDDADGEVVEEHDASDVTGAAVRAVVRSLTGEIQQVPSAVSAIKVDGKRAYKRVRDGETVLIPPRTVRVSEFTVVDMVASGPLLDVTVRVECSTGTYVRALARDVGAALGVGGHLTRLRRTRVGPYLVGQARTLDDLADKLPVVPLDVAAAAAFPTHVVVEARVDEVRHGRPLAARLGAPGPVAVLAPTGRFIALYEQHGPVAKPIAVFDPA
ncbi:MAG: tRNA pseudouridine(55) synthase TruB [Nocardioidaceae bacterium]